MSETNNQQNTRLLTETQRLQTYAGLDDDGYRLDKYGKAIAEKQDAKTRDAVLKAVKAELEGANWYGKPVKPVAESFIAIIRTRLGEKP